MIGWLRFIKIWGVVSEILELGEIEVGGVGGLSKLVVLHWGWRWTWWGGFRKGPLLKYRFGAGVGILTPGIYLRRKK